MKTGHRFAILSALGAALLAGCGPSPQYAAPAYPSAAAPVAVAPGAAPVVVQQSSGVTEALMGGAMGYMLGRSSGGAGATNVAAVSSRTVVNRTVIVNHPPAAPAAAPTPAPAPARRSYGSVLSSTAPARATATTRSYGSLRRR